ncbi:hypothetical protein [Caldimonas tepidiphila]|nr:hypothetical protein [Caldimonas tepidiphila]
MSSKKTKTPKELALQGDMIVQHHRDQKLQQYTDNLLRCLCFVIAVSSMI